MKPYITQDDLYVGCLFTFRGPVKPLLVVWMNQYCIFCVNQLEKHIVVKIMYSDRFSKLTHLNQTPGVIHPGRVTYYDLRTASPCSRINAYYERSTDAAYWPYVSLEAKMLAHAVFEKTHDLSEPLSIAS